MKTTYTTQRTGKGWKALWLLSIVIIIGASVTAMFIPVVGIMILGSVGIPLWIIAKLGIWWNHE